MAKMELPETESSAASGVGPTSRELRYEADDSPDMELEQLRAAVQRIETGLGQVYDLVVKIDERERARTDGR